MKNSIFILIAFSLLGWNLHSQVLSNFRKKTVNPREGELKIDTLSIVPGSLSVLNDNFGILPDSLYTINYSGARISFSENAIALYDTLVITYRVFSFDFNREYYLRNTIEIFSGGIRRAMPNTEQFIISHLMPGENNIQTRGSISRGIMIGNQQDLLLNSQLNLQLTGKLTEQLNIEAVISDNNIPLQPEGYSQTIQEFDRVYINILMKM